MSPSRPVASAVALHLGPHVRHHFLADRLHLSVGHLHGRGGAEAAAGGERDVVGGEVDERAGRDGSAVDERNHRDFGFQQSVADLHSGVDPATVGVDVEHDGRRMGMIIDGAAG